MLDVRPFELRRAEQRRREREVTRMYARKMRDATVARWTPLLYVVLALLGACGIAIIATSLGNGCGDVGAAWAATVRP